MVSEARLQETGAFYCVDAVAERHNASPPHTQDPELAYARFPPSRPTRYSPGLLPE